MMHRHRTMGFRNGLSGYHSGSMNTRNKLNQAYATGTLILAIFIGLAFNSWWVFGAAALCLFALNLFGRQIRIGGSRR